MAIKDNINSFREKVQTNKVLKVILLIANMILPIIALLTVTDNANSIYLNLFTWLWVGFYSTIFSFLFMERKPLIGILIFINIIIIGFILFASLGLAGLPGLLFTIIKMIFPFIPFSWLQSVGIEMRS